MDSDPVGGNDENFTLERKEEEEEERKKLCDVFFFSFEEKSSEGKMILENFFLIQ